ncbi:MAG: molybdopterin-dependent oxidoreductase, partial [Chloroflexi bacterium]|nr:molybdopterin-dependent oxidoreductase [Chloroflexota bacterium]
MAGQPNPNRSQGANEPTRPASGRTEAFWGQLTRQLDDWLRFEPDGTVFAFSGKVEIGTGTRTALAQIVAEELDVPFERVHMVMGDTELTPDEGYTAGSMTIQMSGSALRNASAEARLAMLEMAAEKLDADPVELAVKDGVISVVKDPERKITYGDLMGGKRFEREVTGEAPLKPPESYHIVGASVPRVDFLPKFTGMQSFIQDLRVPGMLHGRVVRPPSPGARLISLDESSVKDVPGLIKVVRKGSFVGVVAEREEQAVLAAERLKVDWQEAASLPGMDDLYTYLRSQPTED